MRGIFAYFSDEADRQTLTMTIPARRHQFLGFVNPRCTVCGKTPMQVQRDPLVACRRFTLPFEDPDRRPLAVTLPLKKADVV